MVFNINATLHLLQVEEFTCEKEGEGVGEKEKEGRLECSTDWDGDAVMASRLGHTTPRCTLLYSNCLYLTSNTIRHCIRVMRVRNKLKAYVITSELLMRYISFIL